MYKVLHGGGDDDWRRKWVQDPSHVQGWTGEDWNAPCNSNLRCESLRACHPEFTRRIKVLRYHAIYGSKYFEVGNTTSAFQLGMVKLWRIHQDFVC
uniref:Uncharacterized protein n=1 Tax=Arundo donax TaxID=35708 RepID=A0A0A9A0S2_ARUDO